MRPAHANHTLRPSAALLIAAAERTNVRLAHWLSVLKLLAFVLPLAVDSFAIAALLGRGHQPGRAGDRLQSGLDGPGRVGRRSDRHPVQLGLLLGARVGERLREDAERLTALALIGLGLFVLIERLPRRRLVRRSARPLQAGASPRATRLNHVVANVATLGEWQT